MLGGDVNAKAVEWGILDIVARFDIIVTNVRSTTTFRRTSYWKTVLDIIAYYE